MDSASALSELKAFQGSRKGVGDYAKEYNQELGVNEAQSRSNDVRRLIRNTEGALRGVNASVAGRTRGNLVNEAQRARLEGIERAPIAQELGTLQSSYADEQQNYRDLLAQATARAGQAYQTDADKLAALESNYNKLYASEQAAAEQRRWEQQQAESRRQFDEQMRAAAANAAATRAQYAQLASFTPTIAPKAQAVDPKAAERQRALEEAARHAREGAASAAKNPYKKATIFDGIAEWWRTAPTSSTFNFLKGLF